MVALQSTIVALAAVAIFYYLRLGPSSPKLDVDSPEQFSCHPFLPKLFVETPPSAEHPLIKNSVGQLQEFLASRFSQGDIDSLSVAVVTSRGPVFEQNYGVIKGNESASPPATSHSSYRISSVAKLFLVLEGHILAEKGIISWDDAVEKYLPGFTYRMDGYISASNHMSGLGRDWPPGAVHNWPRDMFGMGPPPTNGLPFPSNEALLEAIKKHRLTSPPWSHPAYCNAGTGLLGIALVVANRVASEHPDLEPVTYAELIKRDIFDPLAMNGSHFLATEANKNTIVVPSLAPEVADQDFLDAMNSAAGQFSSLSDTITFLQTLLNPAHPKSLLSRWTMDKWMRPVHSFEEDDWTEIGFIWEIIKARDSNGRLRKIYWKLGAMAGYHTAIAIHPGTSYGISILEV